MNDTTLAQHVRTLGRGPGRSRSLTRDEASEAMGLMLHGADAHAVGALLMLLRMKGETAEEIAGLAEAAQAAAGPLPQVDLDWPSYAAGRTRGLPWFLLSAKLLASAGHRVLIHGWNGPDAAVRQGVRTLGIACAATATEAEGALARDGLVYMPLEEMHPALFSLLKLRGVLGLRSCVNTVCRMLNPGRATASVQGVFHPSYRLLQADAAQLLGWDNLSVIKGGGGEFERHPGKLVEGFGLRRGAPWQGDQPGLIDDGMRLADLELPQSALLDLWRDDQGPEFARQMVLGTAQLALETLGDERFAAFLWEHR
ncbi:glycosyl transferase family protein [Sagittula sp. S175]|uniref:glycosyl transferase family protein n=1 Tax=Sagittula sp. S175 TaxID=3415129 RepID=UPI003C7C993D